jgi:hypothetical protein
MSQPQPAEPAMLAIGVLHEPAFELSPLLAALRAAFGPEEAVSDPLPFDHTSYYAPEMGPGLLRRFVAMAELFDPGRLVAVKLRTNEIERGSLNEHGGRRVNLDPGALTLSNFVLATGKARAHRPYLGDGVYADLTLLWRDGAWVDLPWTYPDYRSEPVKAILADFRERCRRRLAAARRQWGCE